VKQQVFYPLIFLISLIFFGIAQMLPSFSTAELQESMQKASVRMDQASLKLKECREESGLQLNLQTDINATGLIGVEFSDITTSLGQLEAKRTTANPNFAALMIVLLNQAGVKQGDTIAVGASGSFPALLLAVLSASQALELRPLVIFSIGASQWGANDPDFHGLKMWDCLVKNDLWDFELVALSLGGDRDRGENMSAQGYTLAKNSIDKSGVTFIDEPDLIRNVATRMRLYKQAAGSAAIKVFINIGGSYANLGTDSAVLSVPPPEKRGVLFAMAAEKVPVIHLLYIRGLAREFGLPWDPAPLPHPGTGAIFQRNPGRDPQFMIFAVSYLLLVFTLIFIHFRSGRNII